jgi:hypothetical protein
MFSILFGFSSLSLVAQEKAELSSSDKKKIEKAEKELLKAEKKYKEADKLFAEVVEKQSDLTAEESDKLNNKAMGKQIESITIEFEAKSDKYNVYALRVELFWVRNPSYIEVMRYANSLDNDAKNDFSSANELFKEQSGISDNLIRLGKISDARDFLNKALDKMIQAFELCANPSTVESAPVTQPETIQYKADTISYDSTKIMPQTSVSIDSAAVPNSKDTIISISNPASAEITEPAPAQEKTEPLPVAQDSSPAEVTAPAPQTQAMPEPTPEAVQPASPPSTAEPVVIDTPSAPVSIKESESGVVYKVQIAASRVPLNAQQLSEIYSGTETPEEQLIAEWYKYTIGSFSDYESAKSFKESCGVEDAFVVRR